MKIHILLVICILVLADTAIGQQSVKPTDKSTRDAIKISVQEDADSAFHVRILAPMYLGNEQFEILALHGRNEGEHALEVGVIVEEASDLMLEGWIHVFGIEELQRYSLHIYYSAPCEDKNPVSECRREYVFEPINFVDR